MFCDIVLTVPTEQQSVIIMFEIRRSTQVGRRGAPAKGVGRILTGARVQFSPSPPKAPVKAGAYFFQKCRRRLAFLAFYRFRFICVFLYFSGVKLGVKA